MHETGSIIDTPSPKKRASAAQSSDFMELWQARCVQGYVAVHLHPKIRTLDLAKVAQFSLGRFSRTFKASFGCTPRQYVNRLRVARAQNLMIMSSDPLSLIALESGFADQSLQQLFPQNCRRATSRLACAAGQRTPFAAARSNC
jgi:transcriptional regulator GlxA family with amidase domain